MLANLITLPFKDVDGTTDLTQSFELRSSENGISRYKQDAVIVDASLPENEFILKAVEPKAVSNFYGTQRNYLTFREGFEISTPVADAVRYPQILKLEHSCPVGVSPDDKLRFFNRLLALMSHVEFYKFYMYQTLG
jgi:hypothetical protein